MAPVIEPESAYLKPLNVVHPFYYPRLARCPQCESNSVWEGWTTTGSRDVHGVSEEEAALGFQSPCKDCEASGTTKGHRSCVASTKPVFRKKMGALGNPKFVLVFHAHNGTDCKPSDDVPHFFKQCTVTRDLFNVIVELV